MNPERPIFRYFGGKWMLAPWIIEHFPDHRIYVEPYGGGASVLLRKPRSWAEIYNDLDAEIVNVFRIIQTWSHELKRRLEATPFSRDEYYLAHEPTDCPLERARRSIVRSFMGHGADSLTRGYRSGFRANSNHDGQGRNAALDWINYMPAIEAFRERLMGVIVENQDAKKVMDVQDSRETLHFVDPPYLHSTRSFVPKHGYRFEMTEQDHVDLCSFLSGLKGMVILCGYRNSIYDSLGWRTFERRAYADGAQERVETLWLNPAAVRGLAQPDLFDRDIGDFQKDGVA